MSQFLRSAGRALALVVVFSALVAPASLRAAEPTSALPPGLEMLRRTERGFAKATSEIGVRNGFLTFFAEDVVMPPEVGPARAGMVGWPNPVEPRPTDLVWEPLYGDIARSMNLGYLTGPSSFTDRNGKKHTGVYFSIWRRNAEGLWRVVLDAGLDMPSAAPEFASNTFRAAQQTSWKSADTTDQSAREAESLKQAEREFFTLASTSLTRAYEQHLSEHARLHREGKHPLLGRTAILADLRAQSPTLSGEALRTEAAASGDLGWTYGPGKMTVAGKLQEGVYTHVWKRDDQGRWKIVVDLFNPPRQ
jgi:ketosteroid isomerase-like protein